MFPWASSKRNIRNWLRRRTGPFGWKHIAWMFPWTSSKRNIRNWLRRRTGPFGWKHIAWMFPWTSSKRNIRNWLRRRSGATSNVVYRFRSGLCRFVEANSPTSML
jgi:hypothetical protein